MRRPYEHLEGAWNGGPSIFNLRTKWCEWSASCSGCFNLKETVPNTHSLEGWVAAEPAWTLWRRDKSVVIAGNRATFLRSSSPYPTSD